MLRHVRLPLLLLALVACSSKHTANDKGGIDPSAPVADKGDPLPTLAPNAPKDQPVRRTTAEQERRVKELTEQAQKSYPDAKRRFLAGLPVNEHFYVVTTLTSPGAKENVFISVSSITAGQVKGTIASDILNVKGYKSGDAYTFAETELVDWLISKADGSEEGNVVGKYLDTLH
jgi:Uncharacterized protein conserved in bacteria (DUF2314)